MKLGLVEGRVEVIRRSEGKGTQREGNGGVKREIFWVRG